MRTVLTWAYYAVHAEWQIAVVFVFWASLLLATCYVWKRTVDEFSLQVSRRAEELTSGKVGLNFGYSDLYPLYRKKHIDLEYT